MNYSGFKKVHEDDEKAILKHKNGSELKIAKKSIKPEHREALKKLPLYAAEGIDVQSPDNDAPPAVPQSPVNIYLGSDRAQSQSLSQPAPSEPQPSQSLAPEPQPQQAVPQEQQTQTPVQQEQPQPNSQEPQPTVPSTPEEHHAQELQSNLSASDAWKNDLFNGHIQPKTYHDLFAEKSTLGKIGTLFGLLVSGAGSGLSHQPNAVLSMMQNEINNDFNAQVKSKENAMNYYRANLAHQLQQAQIPGIIATGKLTQAEAETKAYALGKMQANWAALHDLVQQNQKLPPGSPMRQQGDQVLGMMYQAITGENYSIADKAAAASALMNFGTAKSGEPGYAQRAKMLNMSGNEKINQFQDPRHVPGFGDASIEVPQDTRQELIAKKEYDQAAKNYIAFAQQHKNNWANLNPTQRLAIARQGAVLGAELQGKYRMKTHGGVYKEGEQHFIKTIIPDNAASWQASFNQLPKVQQTIDNNRIDTGNLAKSYGLPEPDWNGKPQEKQQSSKPKPSATGHEEGATGIQKSTGKPIVFKNGKWSYQ